MNKYTVRTALKSTHRFTSLVDAATLLFKYCMYKVCHLISLLFAYTMLCIGALYVVKRCLSLTMC